MAESWGNRWAGVCAYMISVWHRTITLEDEAAGVKLLRSLPIEAVEDAVTELAEAGGEYLPPWSQIYAKAAAIAKDLRPALPAPDLTRSLSAEERDRAARMGAILRGNETTAVREAWLAFAHHARRKVAGPNRGSFKWERCMVCDAIAGLVMEGGHQSTYYATLEPDCCEVGRPLFAAWRRASNALVRLVFHPLEQSA